MTGPRCYTRREETYITIKLPRIKHRQSSITRPKTLYILLVEEFAPLTLASSLPINDYLPIEYDGLGERDNTVDTLDLE